MKESRVYNLLLMRFLLEKGFNYLRIEQNRNNPKYCVWVFKDTPELHEAIHTFTRRK